MTNERSRSVSRRSVLTTIGAGAAAGLAGCMGGDGDGEDTTTSGGGDGGEDLGDSMTIFHAGSLEPPFGAAETEFEDEYDVQVNREAKGSVASTKKITQQGRWADVLGVSDFRLLRNRLLPDKGDWYAIFTTNAMSLAYRPGAPGADEISKDNWWEVLSRDDVTIGHSDPAVDPGGYRAVMAQQLGSIPFDGSKLYDDATYQKMRENSTVPTGTEINLKSQLKTKKLDYAFYYQSIASTSEGLEFVDLQPEVDLSKATSTYAKHYAKAKVEAGDSTYTGAPIAYGVTVPGNAKHPGLGARWVEYMITEPGKEILRNKGLQPVETAVVPKSGKDSVPDRVMQNAEAKENLGPLEL